MESFPNNLVSERLQLEPLTAEWLDDLVEQNTGNVARYSEKFVDHHEAHNWINDCQERHERKERLGMVVLAREGRQFLGVASIQKINIDPQLGIWIKEEAQGHGYGQESVKCLVDWFKASYGQEEKIKYLAEKGNVASIKLARKMCMESNGDKPNDQGIVFEEFQL